MELPSPVKQVKIPDRVIWLIGYHYSATCLFFNCERENYRKEAEKYGFKTFSSSDEAEKELLGLLRIGRVER